MQAKRSSPQSRKRARAKAKKPARSSPSSTALIKPDILSIPEAIEKVLILGDLSSLEPQQRVDYYKRVCNSLGVNPLTMPFSYILFREFDGAPAKLSLYANKSCTEQLRKIHGVSVIPPMRRTKNGDIITVEVDVRDRTGRTDTASGSVPTYKIKDGKRIDFTGKDLCNADMKCETKAKRRATLSISGLAFLDESELDTMQVVGGVTPDGRIFRYAEEPSQEPRQLSETVAHGHPAGSEKAKQAEATLARVEAEDRALREAKTVLPKASVPQEQPKASVGAPVRGDMPILEAEAVGPDRFRIIGDVDPVLPMLQKWCKWEDFWYCDLLTLQKMQGIQERMKFQLKVIPNTKPTSNPSKSSGKESPAKPELVKGVIDRVFTTTTANKAPMRQVTILLPDKKKPTYGCFDKALFDYLDKAKGAIEAYVTTSGKYQNLVGLKRIVTTEGVKEFDADGKTLCVQNSSREAGQKTLYP
jgi:hypothetical protein